VFDLFGRVPRSGETVTHENFRFLIDKMKGARIVKLNLTIIKPENNAENLSQLGGSVK